MNTLRALAKLSQTIPVTVPGGKKKLRWLGLTSTQWHAAADGIRAVVTGSTEGNISNNCVCEAHAHQEWNAQEQCLVEELTLCNRIMQFQCIGQTQCRCK